MAILSPEHFDMVVIGAGPAGEKGAAEAAYFGKRGRDRRARRPRPGRRGASTRGSRRRRFAKPRLYLTGFRHRDVYEGLSLDLDPTFAVNRLRASNRVVETITGEVRSPTSTRTASSSCTATRRSGPSRTVLVRRQRTPPR